MISIVIPSYNEDKNLTPLYNEITFTLSSLKRKYEIIFVNDGSVDDTQAEIESLYQSDKEHVRGIQFLHNTGKAAALQAGFQTAQGNIIITMDADLQDVPLEIPRFISKIEKEGFDMVSGWKQQRKDSFIKNKTSKLFNAATNAISRVKLHDFNCGFKAYRSEVAKELNLYGELHRYIPVIVSAKGYDVAELPVEHRKRLHGKTKYGLIRFIHGFLDLITVLFLTKFQSRPLHLFGYIGLAIFLAGLIGGVYLTFTKIFLNMPIGSRPLLLLSVMMMILGTQVIVTGIISEHITILMSKQEPTYKIKKILQ